MIRDGGDPGGRRPAHAGGSFVRVRGGYTPDVVYALAGEPIRLTFLREESAACSEWVVFPAFGKNTMLPRGERVVVELPPSPPGTYEFTCAMNMLRGTLVVAEPPLTASSENRRGRRTRRRTGTEVKCTSAACSSWPSSSS